MAYEAPKLVEVGDVHELTLGSPNVQANADGYWDWGPRPVASR